MSDDPSMSDDLEDNRPEKGFVFIVTYGRSGSTVLQSVLQSMEGYFIRGENNNALRPIFELYQCLVDARTKNTKPVPPPHGPWYGINEVEPDEVAQKAADFFAREILRVPGGTRRAGFKEIRFHEVGVEAFDAFLDFTRRFFAPAKFIFNMRAVDDVAKSGWWRDADYYDVLDMVEICDRLYADYAARHPDDCILMRYEDFKGKPEAFKRLFDFLDEPFDAATVADILANKLRH